MISNNDMVELSIIEYYYDRYEQCLYSNASHNRNFNELNTPLAHLFKWRYASSNSRCVLSKANRHIV